MSEFAKVQREIKEEMNELAKFGSNAMEEDRKYKALNAKLDYYRLVTSEAMIRATDASTKQVKNSAEFLSSEVGILKEVLSNETTALTKELGITRNAMGNLIREMIKSNESLSKSQSNLTKFIIALWIFQIATMIYINT